MYLHTSECLLSAEGMMGRVVIDIRDVGMVAPRDHVQVMKKLVARLDAEGRR